MNHRKDDCPRTLYDLPGDEIFRASTSKHRVCLTGLARTPLVVLPPPLPPSRIVLARLPGFDKITLPCPLTFLQVERLGFDLIETLEQQAPSKVRKKRVRDRGKRLFAPGIPDSLPSFPASLSLSLSNTHSFSTAYFSLPRSTPFLYVYMPSSALPCPALP